MATAAQINANRRNALRSTGPRTDAGKAVSRFNALKTGIEAKSLVIPGEDPTQLETLARNYEEQLAPVGVIEVFFVECLIWSDWERRRMTRIEAEFLKFELTERRRHAATEFPVFESRTARILYGRIAAAHRNYARDLKDLRRRQLQRAAAEIESLELKAELEAERKAAKIHAAKLQAAETKSAEIQAAQKPAARIPANRARVAELAA